MSSGCEMSSLRSRSTRTSRCQRPSGRRFHCTSQRSRKPLPRNGASECMRSEEHTSELQSQFHLVCRLPLEKKKAHSGPDSAFSPALLGFVCHRRFALRALCLLPPASLIACTVLPTSRTDAHLHVHSNPA